MAFAVQMPSAAAAGAGGSDGGSGANNTSSSPPYYLPASYFPVPETLSTTGLLTAVSVAPLPDAPSSFGVVFGITNDSNSSLWFVEGSYSPTEARAIATNGTCGPGCGQLPLSWSAPANLSLFNASVSAASLTSAGSVLVVAASSNNTTYLFSSHEPYSSWARLGTPLAGSLGGLAATPEEVAAVTIADGAACATLLTVDGSVVGQTILEPSGGNSTGVLSAGVALTPDGATYLESVAFTVNGSSEVQFASSTDGTDFSAPVVIGNFSSASPNASLSPAGATSEAWTGGAAGQLAMTSVASDLFVLFTTNQSGETVPATEVSGDNGTNWSGAYLTEPGNGSVLDPTLAVGPTGWVYATWEAPDYGTGALEEATYAADGLPLAPPQTLPSSSENGLSPTTAPGVAVDAFGRPLLVWGVAPTDGTNGSVAYTGGYLGPSLALNLTEDEVSSTVALPDFTPRQLLQDQEPPTQALETNVSLLVAGAEENLSEGRVCAAQNVTGLALYQNLTHEPLVLLSGSGTVCDRSLASSEAASPLEPSVGLDVPNTFYAVYDDWALEAEGVPIATSPLTSVTDVYPYTSLALSATLPTPESDSEKVGSETASVTVTPTPYSPTAYELAAIYLIMACVGAMMVAYVFTTSITNYQAGHATGKAIAALSAVTTMFGLLGMALIWATNYGLSSGVRLLLLVGALFSLFDFFACAAIILT